MIFLSLYLSVKPNSVSGIPFHPKKCLIVHRTHSLINFLQSSALSKNCRILSFLIFTTVSAIFISYGKVFFWTVFQVPSSVVHRTHSLFDISENLLFSAALYYHRSIHSVNGFWTHFVSLYKFHKEPNCVKFLTFVCFCSFVQFDEKKAPPYGRAGNT